MGLPLNLVQFIVSLHDGAWFLLLDDDRLIVTAAGGVKGCVLGVVFQACIGCAEKSETPCWLCCLVAILTFSEAYHGSMQARQRDCDDLTPWRTALAANSLQCIRHRRLFLVLQIS